MSTHTTDRPEEGVLPYLHSSAFSWLDPKRPSMSFAKRLRSPSRSHSLSDPEDLPSQSPGYLADVLGHCRSPSTTSTYAESLTYSASSIASTPSTPGTFPSSPAPFLCDQEAGLYKEVYRDAELSLHGDSAYPEVIAHHRRPFSPQIHVIMEESDECDEDVRRPSPGFEFHTLTLPIRVRRSKKRVIRRRGGSDPIQLSRPPSPSSSALTPSQPQELPAELPASSHLRTKSLPTLSSSRSLIQYPGYLSESGPIPRPADRVQELRLQRSMSRSASKKIEQTTAPEPDYFNQPFAPVFDSGNQNTEIVERICHMILREVHGIESSYAPVPLKVVDAVVRCLEDIETVAHQHGWSSNRVCQAFPAGNSTWNSPGATSTSSSEQNGAGGANSRKRNSQQAGDGDDGYFNDSYGGNGGDEPCSPDDMSRKKARTELQQAAFSCPFRKRNPLRFNIRDYEQCCRRPIIGIPELKRHIRTWHRREAPSLYQCRRCKKGFSSEEALDRHSELPKDQMCEPSSRKPTQDPEDGITDEMDKTLAGRKANGKIQTWDQICRLIFPMDHDIPQPIFEPVIELHEVKDELKKAKAVLSGDLQRELSEINDMDPGRGFQILRALETVVDVYVASAMRNCRGRLGSSPASAIQPSENTASRRSSTLRAQSIEQAPQAGASMKTKSILKIPIPLRRLAPQRTQPSSQLLPSPSLPPMSESGDTSSLTEAQLESHIPSPESGLRDSGISLQCDAEHNCTANAGGCLCQLRDPSADKVHQDIESFYAHEFSQQYPGWINPEFWTLPETNINAGLPAQRTVGGPQMDDFSTFVGEGHS
ncbi:hypothetical protein jhhlp_003778 [Lomentospora prolificans]|uniref:C2H2-type domain-containing protein n=1 Tax=Lomentospora prolificans TaxID=41688 RepID=A0A2N3N9S4_9PEZI|nr:hypothetical protein jhhlp_003778 [Lomentospora prolificans]